MTMGPSAAPPSSSDSAKRRMGAGNLLRLPYLGAALLWIRGIFPERAAVPLGGRFDRLVPWMIAPMGFMATLALASAMAVSSLAARWDTGLSGVVTVQVPPSQDSPADEQVLQNVLQAVRAAPGVAGAELVDDEAVARLLAPWLGSDLAMADLPVPRLVDVRLADRDRTDLAQMRAALAAIAPGAVVDDHGAWIADLKDVAGTVQWVAALAGLLVAAAAVAAVVFVTGSQMAAHRDVIGILHTLGATDSYIARQYQRHV